MLPSFTALRRDTMERWRVLLPLLLGCWLAGCASLTPPPPLVDTGLLHDEAFAAPSAPIDARAVWEVLTDSALDVGADGFPILLRAFAHASPPRSRRSSSSSRLDALERAGGAHFPEASAARRVSTRWRACRRAQAIVNFTGPFFFTGGTGGTSRA